MLKLQGGKPKAAAKGKSRATGAAAPKRKPATKKGKGKKGGNKSEDDEIASDDSLNEFIADDEDEIVYAKSKKPKGRKK